jgi:hypothetical protein
MFSQLLNMRLLWLWKLSFIVRLGSDETGSFIVLPEVVRTTLSVIGETVDC